MTQFVHTRFEQQSCRHYHPGQDYLYGLARAVFLFNELSSDCLPLEVRNLTVLGEEITESESVAIVELVDLGKVSTLQILNSSAELRERVLLA